MLQRYIGFIYLSAVSQLCLRATQAGCPLQISPQRVVVRYGDSVSADCKALVTHMGMGWESPVGAVPMTTASLITWRVSKLKDWDIETLFCFINYDDRQCELHLPVTVFKTPDSVSISTGDQIMTEGNQYELQCDIHNVAPVQKLTVNWYKGETLVDQTIFLDTVKSPVNTTSKLLIRPDRHDDRAQFRCEAELKLGENGPQPPPKVTSDPLSVKVHSTHAGCPLQISPQRVVVRYGDSVSADCKALVPHDGMGWESPVGAVPMTTASLITWRVSKLTDWNIVSLCYINYNGLQCIADLPVTVFKTPDSVSISTGDQIMTEGKQYELHCDIHNVAPVQNLTVNWYKRETLVGQTIFLNTVKSPVNKTSRLLIRPDRHDDGAQFRCEAELKLGENGPQPPPKVTSDPLSVKVHSTHAGCPLQISPQRVVVRYGNSVSADCKALVPHDGMGWESPVGAVPMTTASLITWRVSKLTDWDIETLFCFINYDDRQCELHLPVTVFKTPDSVSISTGDQIMTEGNQYELQCDIHNVAPVQKLTVNWYKGETLVDQTIFLDTVKSPVNTTSKLLIRPDRHDDRAQFRCEAELKLGENGPQPPPKVTSDPLSVKVHY